MSKKLVLAYSGGLDTSYCAKYLSKEEGFEIHAVSVNTGGFSKEEIQDIKEKALQLPAAFINEVELSAAWGIGGCLIMLASMILSTMPAFQKQASIRIGLPLATAFIYWSAWSIA